MSKSSWANGVWTTGVIQHRSERNDKTDEEPQD